MNKMFVDNNIYDLTDAIKEEYTSLKKDNYELRKELEEFNQDEKIKECLNRASYYLSHSLIQLSDIELKALCDFRDRHYKKCAEPLHSKIAGNTYIYTLTGTGIGTIIKIKCPICGEEEDVTDLDSW